MPKYSSNILSLSIFNFLVSLKKSNPYSSSQQTGILTQNIPIILFGKNFWEKAVNFEYLAEAGMISKDDLKLMKTVDSVSEAMDYIIPILKKIV